MIRRQAEMRRETREHMRGGEGTVAFEHLLEKDDFKARMRLCSRLTLPPGSGIGPHAHETEDEIYIILSGSGLLDEGSGPVRVSAGDAVLTGRGQSHAIRNDGAAPLELIAVIACY